MTTMTTTTTTHLEALRARVGAEPPRRPWTVTNGRSIPWSSPNDASAAFDSAAPMKPTGQPTIAAGRGPPASTISSRWKSAVGALPIATTAPSSSGSQSETAAAVRVVLHAAAREGTWGSVRKQCTSLPRAAGRR